MIKERGCNNESQNNIDKMMEIYSLYINVNSDALWSLNSAKGTVYRSSAFNKVTGYSDIETVSMVEWFLEKIHADDKGRLEAYVHFCCTKHVEEWENEFRFLSRDGNYIYLSATAKAIFSGERLIHITGAIQDVTERKKLEATLMEEKVKQQHSLNRAIIKSRERERKRIGRELHDNVNQLLTSAKLYIGLAKNKARTQVELLQKANEYLGTAVEEIRDLTKRITITPTTGVGLYKNLVDIGTAMQVLQNIRLDTFIREEVIERLSAEQQLMVYRIVQEQTTNIMKYAESDKAVITLKEKDQNAELIISDNGKGFDKATQNPSGIGFMNIFNRVNAHHGSVDIISSPGNGCKLIVLFPIAALQSTG